MLLSEDVFHVEPTFWFQFSKFKQGHANEFFSFKNKNKLIFRLFKKSNDISFDQLLRVYQNEVDQLLLMVFGQIEKWSFVMLCRAPRGVYASYLKRMFNLIFLIWVKQDMFLKFRCLNVFQNGIYMIGVFHVALN